MITATDVADRPLHSALLVAPPRRAPLRAAGVVRLSGLEALTQIDGDLSIIDAPALVELGAPKLVDVGSVRVIDAPKRSDSEIAAFLDQVGGPPACFGGRVECGCVLPSLYDAGCPALLEGGSAVSGQSEDGPFDGATAFFGQSDGEVLQLVIVDANADIAEAKNAGLSASGKGAPKVMIDTGRIYPFWVRTSTVEASLIYADDGRARDQRLSRELEGQRSRRSAAPRGHPLDQRSQRRGPL